jgi:hypothetical protein
VSVQVSEGYLLVPFPLAIPPEFWERLKARMTAEQLGEFRGDYDRERALAVAARSTSTAWSPVDAELEREDRFFRRWAERVCGPQALWPWEQGWTAELAASYLLAPAAREGVAA